MRETLISAPGQFSTYLILREYFVHNVVAVQPGLVALMNQVLDGAHMPSDRAKDASASLSTAIT